VLVGLSVSAMTLGDFKRTPFNQSNTFSFPARGYRNPVPGSSGFVSPVCSLKYRTSDPDYSLGIVDFAFFNKLVYEPEESLDALTNVWLPAWHKVYERRRELRCGADCDKRDWTSWFVFEGLPGTKLENTTVVTIRGTKSTLEKILDIEFWSTSVMINFASQLLFVGPVFNEFWSSSWARSWYRGKKVRYQSVVTYIKNRTQVEPHRIYYVSGHSLGGGIAGLVAAELGIPSVGLSAPGVSTTAELLQLETARLQALVVNVIPETDPIPGAGGPQKCVALPIGCVAPPGPACHRVFNTVCELLDECGDESDPPRPIPCTFCPAKLESQPSLAKQCAGKR